MRLEVRRLHYSFHPWRIVLVQDDGQCQELRFFSFLRKRDALPVLAQLEALALPWATPPASWPEAQRAHIASIIDTLPGWQVHQQAVARERSLRAGRTR
jgi:hypothetical protein